MPLRLAEGTALTGTEKIHVIPCIVTAVWRELGKENENDHHQSTRYVFNQERLSGVRMKLGETQLVRSVFSVHPFLAWCCPAPMETSTSAGSWSTRGVTHALEKHWLHKGLYRSLYARVFSCVESNLSTYNMVHLSTVLQVVPLE